MKKEVTPMLNLEDIRAQGFVKDHFRILSMKNTVLHRVGECLSIGRVEKLIRQEWIINIK